MDYHIFLADATVGKIYHVSKFVNQTGFEIKTLPIKNIARPVALAYDSKEDVIYWSDVTRDEVGRSMVCQSRGN